MFAQYCSLLLLKNNTFFASFGLLVGCLLPRFDIFFLIEEEGKKLDNCEQLPFISVLRDDVSTERGVYYSERFITKSISKNSLIIHIILITFFTNHGSFGSLQTSFARLSGRSLNDDCIKSSKFMYFNYFIVKFNNTFLCRRCNKIVP